MASSILITGAGGFVGMNLAWHYHAQANGSSIDLLYKSQPTNDINQIIESNKKMRAIPGDIVDFSTLKDTLGEYDLIIHLAAISDIPTSMKHPRLSFKVNCEGLVNIMEIARRSSNTPTIVVMSSAAVYGKPDYLPIDEKHPLNGSNPYAAQKIIVERISAYYSDIYGIPTVALRPFNLYGRYQRDKFLIPSIINQAINKEKIVLGNPHPIRNYTHVSDFIKVISLIEGNMKKAAGHTFNVGNSRGISVKSLSEMICRIMNIEKEIEFDQAKFRPDKIEVSKMTCDYSKIKDILGWEPNTTLEDGLKDLVDFSIH
ncbi:MAG: NAD-dependent epimerase/dehydratase family protein [Promethearchaeota archaeon]